MGDEQIADGYQSLGSLDGWRQVAALVKPYPRALTLLYASFVPPLLPIIRSPNFVVDMAHRTSAGKTTALRASASVWGNPNDHEPDSVLRSWDSTRVFIERAASILSALPLFLDETKRVKDPQEVATVLYEITQGQGRNRGNTKSTASTRAWRTVLLSTGEAPAVTLHPGRRDPCAHAGDRWRAVRPANTGFGGTGREDQPNCPRELRTRWRRFHPMALPA